MEQSPNRIRVLHKIGTLANDLGPNGHPGSSPGWGVFFHKFYKVNIDGKSMGKTLETIKNVGVIAGAGTLALGLWAVTSPVWLPFAIYNSLKTGYHSLRDLKYKKDENVVNYPVAEDIMDFESRMLIRGSPNWTRGGVGEVELDSGQIAVYSSIFSRNFSPSSANSIEIDGYKLNPRKVKRVPKDEKEKVIGEVRQKLGNRLDLSRVDRIYCM